MAGDCPFVIEPARERDPKIWIASNKTYIDEVLDRCGAILLRGFDILTEQDFAGLVRAYSTKVAEYMYRSTPRADLGAGIYTSTEYPAGLSIALHNENAYQRDWPLRLFFFCMHPADGDGGQTPLARMVNVTKRIDATVCSKFYEKKVMYIRNYHKDIDIPWKTVFQTDSKAQVEDYCEKHDIEFEWSSTDSLRTKQICQSFAKHPRTGEVIWFNSATLFHPSNLDSRSRKALAGLFSEDDFPRNVKLGDGSPIDEADLDHVRAALASETETFEWHSRDVLILDNMLTAHGRTPYKGKRRVLTAMCDLMSSYR
jgi:hypothetical protein